MSEFEYDVSDDIGLGDEDKGRVKSNKTDWYTMTDKGRTDRVALVYYHALDQAKVAAARAKMPGLTDEQIKQIVLKVRADRAAELGKSVDQLTAVDMLDLSSAKFRACDASYKEGLGYVEWPRKLEPSEKEVWAKLPAPKSYVSTALLIYPTDREGNIDKERIGTHFQVKPFRFSPDKYERMKVVNKKILGRGGSDSLATYDLTFECQEPKFHKIQIDDASPALWLKNEKLKNLVLSKALDVYPKLSPFRKMTTEELREKLGVSGGGAATSDMSPADFDNVLAGI